MRTWISIPRSRVDGLALEAQAARAALACPYSSSDEYEAAVISARRAAGAYSPTWRRRDLVWAGVAAVAVVTLLMLGV
jgi:hypothetical protein